MNYAFIGLGNMAGAILRGMQTSGRFRDDKLYGFDTNPQAALELEKSMDLIPAGSADEAAANAEVIVLCVKPQVMSGVLQDIRESIDQSKAVITIAAGLPISFYESRLSEKIAVIRAMPSINAMALSAASAVCGNRYADERNMTTAMKLLGAIGAVHEVEEKHFAAFSAIAGAAPAFAFQFADALAQAGVKAGLSRKLSDQVAAELLQGSGKLLMESGAHPRALMDKVTSPGGTTIEGVMALEQRGFSAALHAAVQAVIDKDIKLGKES